MESQFGLSTSKPLQVKAAAQKHEYNKELALDCYQFASTIDLLKWPSAYFDHTFYLQLHLFTMAHFLKQIVVNTYPIILGSIALYRPLDGEPTLPNVALLEMVAKPLRLSVATLLGAVLTLGGTYGVLRPLQRT